LIVDRWQPPDTALTFLVKFAHRGQCLAPDHRLRRQVRAAAPEQAGEAIQHASVKDSEVGSGHAAPKRHSPSWPEPSHKNLATIVGMAGTLASIQIMASSL